MTRKLADGNVELNVEPERKNRKILVPALKLKGFNFISQSEAVGDFYPRKHAENRIKYFSELIDDSTHLMPLPFSVFPRLPRAI